MPQVREHTRRTPSGGTTRVRQHSRRGLLRPARAWRNTRAAFRHGRASRWGLAALYAVLAAAEITAWLTLAFGGLVLATAAILAAATAAAAWALSAGLPDGSQWHR